MPCPLPCKERAQGVNEPLRSDVQAAQIEIARRRDMDKRDGRGVGPIFEVTRALFDIRVNGVCPDLGLREVEAVTRYRAINLW
jgi:hypothetical protein